MGHSDVVRGRSILRFIGSTALAIYGGTAWMACLVGGVIFGALIHEPPDDGTSQGRSHTLAAAFPEIILSTFVLLVVAYGLFAWLLSRQHDVP